MIHLNRRSVKRVFIFFLVYLPVQYLLIGIIGSVISEPWPTFALPGFQKIYSTEGQTKILKPSFYAELEDHSAKYVEISEYQLFNGLQDSQMQGFIRTHFSEPNSYSGEAKRWLKERIEQHHPEANSTGLKVIWKQITYRHIDDSLTAHSVENIKEITISFEDNEEERNTIFELDF